MRASNVVGLYLHSDVDLKSIQGPRAVYPDMPLQGHRAVDPDMPLQGHRAIYPDMPLTRSLHLHIQ